MNNELDAAVADTLSQQPTQDTHPNDRFDNAVAGVLRPNQGQAARAGFALASNTNPDTYAQALRIARRAGLPVQTILNQPTEAKRQDAIGSIDFDTLGKTLPATAALLADVEKAKIAHDDVENMGIIETLVNSFKRGFPAVHAILPSLNMVNQSAGLAIYRKIDERIANGEDPKTVLADYADYGLAALPWQSSAQALANWQAFKAKNVPYGQNKILSSAIDIARLEAKRSAIPLPGVVERTMGAKTWGDALSQIASDPVRFIAAIGPESLVQSAPGLLAAIPAGITLGPGGSALALGSNSFIVDYANTLVGAMQSAGIDTRDPKAIQRGLQNPEVLAHITDQAAKHASVVGVFDAISGGIAGKMVLPQRAANKLAARPLAQEMANIALQTPIQGTLGGLGELGGQLNAGQEIQPGQVLAEVFGNFFGTPAEVISASAKRVHQRIAQVKQAAQDAQALADLNQAAKASKVLARDSSTFEQFIASATEDGPVQHVFIDAATLMQSGAADQVASVSPTVAAQLSEAARTGGQIAIPIEEYTARIAPTDAAQSLLDHLKINPEGLSRAEAQAYMQNHAEELRAEVERTLTEKQNDDTAKQSAEVVRANIKEQLDATARFTPQVNDAYAAMVSNFYATQAARLGTTPEALFQQYPLHVVAEHLVDDHKLNQSKPVTSLHGAEIASPDAPLQDLRTATKDYYVQHLVGKTIHHASLGDIKFTRRGLKKALSSSANPLKLRLFAALPDLLANGELVRTQENQHAATHPNIKQYHWLQGNVVIDGKPLTVEVNIEEHTNGKLYYNHTLPGKEYFQKEGVQAQDPSIPGETPTAEHQRAAGEHPTEGLGPEPSISNVAGSADKLNLHLLEQSPRGSFNPASNTIALLKNADLSTFLHESGHFFLEVQLDMAARMAAQQHDSAHAIKGQTDALRDTQTLLDWFGVRDLAEWNSLNFEEKRNHHEQFARSFEAYLFEGKAPNIEMQSLFQRFRAWLLNVYRDLKALNTELTPEVRGVFDRMLATEEQIALAEQARSMIPLFKSPDQAGMTLEEFAAYQALGMDATHEAMQDLQTRSLRDMQWLHNARTRIIKQLQKDAAARRTEVRHQVAQEVNAEPIYRAERFLRYGELELPPGSSQTVRRAAQQANIEAAKLSLSALKEIYGESASAIWRYLPTGKHGLAASEGMHPDLVAELFGFSSGDELVRHLLEAPPRREEIDARTDVQMLEQFGELSTPEAIEHAADRAIHNKARARFVATEANALAQATGQRKLLVSAAREYARAMIDRLRVRDVRPSQYANAEVRAARAAERAMKSGDLAKAAAEKRNQLIHNYATRAAHDAQDVVERGLRYLRKFDGDIKGLAADYADQINNLLERFDLRKGQSLKAIDKRTTLANWLESQREAGFEPEIPSNLENEAFRTSYKNMTIEEFQGLIDTVHQIEHLGRLKNRLLTAANQRTYEAARDEIAASIREHAQHRHANTRTPTTHAGRAAQTWKRFWASHIKAATWARIMDGGKDGGPVWEYFVRNANERGDVETTMRAEATARLSEILAPVFALGKMGGKGQFFPSIHQSLNREARLAIALNMGNEGNTQRLLGGEGWTMAQITPVLQSLTTQEWQAVQAVWDHLESYRPQIAAKERRVYGKEPAWVEPRQLIVATADGNTITLRGGYYPIKYDPAASQRAEAHIDAESAKRALRGAYTTATTRRSFTKARVEEVSGRPLLYTLSGLYSGVNDVIHDLAWHEWLIDTNRLLRSHTIDQAIREHYGPQVKQQLKTWVSDIAEGEKGANAATDLALSRLRQGISASGLGFNVMTALIQPLGLTQSIVRIGATWVGRGMMKYIGSPLELTREVNAKSAFMENRARTRFRELNELRNQVQDQSAFREWVGHYTYFLMMRCQQIADVPTWWGAYEKGLAEGNNEPRAIALADQAVIDSQGGGQTKDLAAIERGGSAQKLFTVFYAFMNTALNMGVAQTMSANTPAKRAKLAVDYAMLYVVPAVLTEVLKAALTPSDKDDEDWGELAKKLSSAQLDYLFGLMVVAREFREAGKIASGLGGRDYEGPTGLRLIADTQKFTGQAVQGEFDNAFRKATVNLVGDLFGLPSAQINRTITGTQAIVEKKTQNPAAFVFGFQESR